MIARGLLLSAGSNNEHYDADCNFTLWAFDSKELRRLLKLERQFIETRGKVPGLHRWALSGADVTFISNRAAEHLFGEERVYSFSSGDPPELVTWDPANLEKFDQTVSDDLFIAQDGFWWEAVPKHSEIIVSSDFISFAWLRTTCRLCGAPEEQHAKGYCLFASTTFEAIAHEPRRKAQARKRHARGRTV